MENKQHGGARPGGGRPIGSPNRATKIAKQTMMQLAQARAETPTEVLVQVATSSESDSGRVAADNALLDRGYGRMQQPPDVDVTGALASGAVCIHLPHIGRGPL